MKTKLISLTLILLMGVYVRGEILHVAIYDDCTLNGYEAALSPAPADVQAVDLGLPSGIKWASCNIGANKPEDYGNYYAWGEVLPKDNYSWSTYMHTNGSTSNFTKYCNGTGYGDNGFTDNKTTLDLENDAAYMNWGSNWRMPTDAELTELREQCTWEWTDDYNSTGVKGYEVKSKTTGNSNSIFLPAAGSRDSTSTHYVGSDGRYWSSSLYKSPIRAWSLIFSRGDWYRGRSSRYVGFFVRPVCPSSATTSTSNSYVTLTLNTEGCESANVIHCYTGQQINVMAVPADEHRHFVRWADANTDNPRLVTVTKDTNLTAIFAYNQYTITVFAGVNGNVNGSGMYEYGATATLTATADEHYHFWKWKDGNTDNPRTVSVEDNATYRAIFAPNQYTISATAENGHIEGTGEYDYGTSAALTAVADEHYHFTQWTDGNTDNPRTVSVESNATYTAIFAPNRYTISATAKNGHIEGTGEYDYGTSATLTAVADEHYRFTQWSDGNTDNPRIVSIEEDATYTVEFAIDQFTITAMAEGSGYVSGDGTYDYGVDVILYAIANNGYHFVQWSDGNTDNPRTISVKDNATYTAIFAPNQYTISATAENGRVEGAGKYDYGTTATLTAVADEHYHFTQWSDGNTDNPRTVVVEGEATYIAEFALDQYTITATCDILQGIVKGGGLFEYGTQTSVEAIPNSGYEFKQWSNSMTYNPYRFTVVSDLTLVAQFIPATAIDNTVADTDTTPQKILIDGQVYILRNGKTYTLTGVEVK